MFEPKLLADSKVSFERDGLDASQACHISARGNVRSRLQRMEAPVHKPKTGEVLSDGAALNACRSSKRSAESSV